MSTKLTPTVPVRTRQMHPRSRWTIRIVNGGHDKGDYWIMRKSDGEYATRSAARRAKQAMVTGKTNVNSWSNQSVDDDLWTYGFGR